MKLEDIPQDIWDAAEAVEAFVPNFYLASEAKEQIARALAAERERGVKSAADLRAHADQLERYRDMWKDQCERQAASLTALKFPSREAITRMAIRWGYSLEEAADVHAVLIEEALKE